MRAKSIVRAHIKRLFFKLLQKPLKRNCSVKPLNVDFVCSFHKGHILICKLYGPEKDRLKCLKCLKFQFQIELDTTNQQINYVIQRTLADAYTSFLEKLLVDCDYDKVKLSLYEFLFILINLLIS